MEFTVSQQRFTGPLGLLLELLQKKELEITEINLAAIADDYLHYLDAHEVPPSQMADFLFVASRLIYAKSRELMPDLAVEEEAGSIEDQLRLYREFLDAAERLAQLYDGDQRAFARPFVARVVDRESRFSPPENVTQAAMRGAFDTLLKRLEPFFVLTQTTMERVKSLEERMGELREAIQSRGNFSFSHLTRGAKKADVVVSFLALLELMRRRVIKVAQKDDDIMIRSYE